MDSDSFEWEASCNSSQLAWSSPEHNRAFFVRRLPWIYFPSSPPKSCFAEKKKHLQWALFLPLAPIENVWNRVIIRSKKEKTVFWVSIQTFARHECTLLLMDFFVCCVLSCAWSGYITSKISVFGFFPFLVNISAGTCLDGRWFKTRSARASSSLMNERRR